MFKKGIIDKSINNKHLEINLMKYVQDLSADNYTIVEKLKKTQVNGGIFHAHKLEDSINITHMLSFKNNLKI